MTMTIKTRRNIYVKLTSEPGEVWRPVEAFPRDDGTYEILSVNADPDNQAWEFVTGDVVQVEEHTFMDGKPGLVARAKH